TLSDVTAALGTEFDVGDAAEEVDTLGGYLFMKIGRVPVRGELVAGAAVVFIEGVEEQTRRGEKSSRFLKRKNRAPVSRRGGRARRRRGGAKRPRSPPRAAANRAPPVEAPAVDQGSTRGDG